MRAALAGWGTAVPDRRLTNAELEQRVDTSDQWIIERTGIRERRVAGEGETTASLAIEAGTASPESVKKRLVRVPTTLRTRLMFSALAHPDIAARRRALSAMAKLEVPNFARDFLMKLDNHLERDLGLAHIREALATMNSAARQKMGGELAPILEKQMASIKDAIDMQTRARLEELKSMLKRA